MPSVAALSAWAFVPLAIALYFAFLRYNLQDPDNVRWFGWNNFYYFMKDPYFLKNLINTLLLVGGVIITTVIGGVALAILFNQQFWGRGIVRVLMISPFFIMPTVSSLVWKNLIMHPVFGLFAGIQRFFGSHQPYDWFAKSPLFSVGMIVSWQWLPFAALILLTALQSLDEEQKDAAAMDGAKSWSYFWHIVLPHLARPITVVILIETIFLMNTFAEIKLTSVGGFAGNLTYLVFSQLNDANDVGAAAAGGLIAVVLANIVSYFLVRIVGKNLEA
jgi:sorbitol/mannitol transport system permease protein